MAVALAASALTSPTFGALPSGASATATATPPTVSSGDYAGFALSFTNNGPSSISSLFLVADTPAGWQFVNTVNGPFLNGQPYGTSSCPNTGGSLVCNFGAVPKQTGPITVTVVYRTPTGVNTTTSLTFHYNSTGSTSGNSHGNDIAAPKGQITLTTDKNFGGRFAYNNTDTVNNTVTDNTNLSKTNKQSTGVNANDVGQTNFELTVQDGTGVVPPTDVTEDCSTQATQLGEWSALDVGNNTTFPNPFRATIVVYQGANDPVTGLCWIRQTGTDPSTGNPVYTGQLLTLPANDCNNPSPTMPCFSLSKVGPNLQVVFISNHNGVLHLSP